MNVIKYRNKWFKYYSPEYLFGSEAMRINLLLALNIYVCHDGTILIKHYDRNKRSFILHRHLSIEKAISSQNKILKDYQELTNNNNELSFFRNLELELENVVQGFEIWNNLDDSAKLANLTIIETSLKALDSNRLILKTEIAKLIEKLNSPLDCLDRLNPGAKKAIATAIKARSRKRTEQVDISMNLAEKRRWALMLEKQYMQKNLLTATIKFGTLNFQLKEGTIPDLKKQIGQLLYLLQSVWLSPYLEEASELKKLILALK